LHRNRWALICLLVLVTIFTWFFTTTAQQENFIEYEIDAEFLPDQREILGTQRVEYINDSEDALDSVYFLLLPNQDREANPYLDPSQIDAVYQNGFDPSWMRIERVADVDNQGLDYELLAGPDIFQKFSLEDNLLRVDLPTALQPGESVRVFIEFRTKFPHTYRGDQAHYRENFSWRFGWNPIAVPATDLIDGKYISDERPYYKFALPAGIYQLNLTLPDEYVAAVGADEINEVDKSGGTKLIEARSNEPTRSIPLAFSESFNVIEFPDSETQIQVYYGNADAQNALLIGKFAADSLNYYRERWGEFPHERLVIVETSSTNANFAGAAADSFILINQLYFREKDLAVSGFMDRLLDYLLAHEVAHQWWGVGVGVDWNAENFLSESFAQYFSITYFEDKYGEFGPNVFDVNRDGILESVVQSQFGYLNLREHMQGDLPYLQNYYDDFDEALIKPQKNVEFGNMSSVRLYNKGYMMLRALEGVLEPEGMDQFLRQSHERFLHKVANLEEMEAIAEQISSRDLGEFFHLALYEDVEETEPAPYADFAINDVKSTFNNETAHYDHEVHLERLGEIRMPVNVVATSRDGEVQSRIWEIDEQLEGTFVMNFETEDQLTEVGVDPRNMSPDINRLNNYYVLDGYSLFNRRLEILASGGNALPLDAYMIRVNPVSQYLEGGYLLDHRWLIGNGLIGYSKNLGRGSAINTLAAISLDGIWGQVSYTKLFFNNPDVGFSAKYWQPSDQLELSYLRRPDSTGRAFYDRRSDATGEIVNAFGLTWIHQEQFRARYAGWGRLMFDPARFSRFEIGGWNSLRLGPGISLESRGSAGWGNNTTGIFRFNLSQLNAYAEVPGYPYFGNAFMQGRVDLRLPFQREMGYNLLNVAVLHNMDERVFFEFGNSWDNLETAQQNLLEGIKTQVGFEMTLSGRTLGGLFPWSVSVGMIYPLTNIDEEQQLLRQYFHISTPFF